MALGCFNDLLFCFFIDNKSPAGIEPAIVNEIK
jgi:hypothetical protein